MVRLYANFSTKLILTGREPERRLDALCLEDSMSITRERARMTPDHAAVMVPRGTFLLAVTSFGRLFLLD